MAIATTPEGARYGIRSWNTQARHTIQLIRTRPGFDTPTSREFIKSCRYFARCYLRELVAMRETPNGFHAVGCTANYRHVGAGVYVREARA